MFGELVEQARYGLMLKTLKMWRASYGDEAEEAVSDWLRALGTLQHRNLDATEGRAGVWVYTGPLVRHYGRGDSSETPEESCSSLY